MPVYNGEHRIGEVLDSLLAQDFRSWEVVVCDNDSSDGTGEVVRAYASRDPRIRWEPNGSNLGQIGNFNRTLTKMRGEFLRWIGDDDLLEPGYVSACVAALDAHPEWIGVTTHQDYTDEHGEVTSAVYPGERLDSPDPVRRYQRMLFFFTANFRYCDPNYAMVRREPMRRAGGLPDCYGADHVFASRLALEGPLGHVADLLAHRGWPRDRKDDEELVAKALNPRKWRRMIWLPVSLTGWFMLRRLLGSDLAPGQKLRCLPTLGRYVVGRMRCNAVSRARRLARALHLGAVKRWVTGRRPGARAGAGGAGEPIA
jgi:glycosyltransferase involved in cell wall biosynthesis